MPAIKAYKYDGLLIPIEEAKVAKAYQCPWTAKVYSTKRGYLKHLAELRTNRMHQKARSKIRVRKLEDFWNQPSFEKLIDWVELNSEFFLKNALGNRNEKLFDKIRDDFWIRITYLNLNWSESVSNSHTAPHTGETNWGGRKPNAPRGYPGWAGEIEFQLSHDLPSFSSDLFRGTRINTGTGSGVGENRFGYGTEFFADDWPAITARRETMKSWNAVGHTANGNKIQLGTARYFKR